jgi:hypothetical protein
MNNHIGAGETAQNRLLYLFGDKVRLNQRQVIVHFQMYLNKAGRP